MQMKLGPAPLQLGDHRHDRGDADAAGDQPMPFGFVHQGEEVARPRHFEQIADPRLLMQPIRTVPVSVLEHGNAIAPPFGRVVAQGVIAQQPRRDPNRDMRARGEARQIAFVGIDQLKAEHVFGEIGDRTDAQMHPTLSRSRAKLSPAQRSARRLFDRGDEALGEGVDLGVGQGRLLRLQGDRDGERFLAVGQALALVDVEQADLGDELAVDAARGAQQRLGRQVAVDDKGEIALDRLEHREPAAAAGRGRARGSGTASRNTSKAAIGPFTSNASSTSGCSSPKCAEHGRPEAQHAGAARVVPGRRIGRDLDVVDRRARRGERGERIGLGVEEIGLARPARANRAGRAAPARSPAATVAWPSGVSSR